MRISDWSSDVCSSDLLDFSSRRSGKAPIIRAVSYEQPYRGLKVLEIAQGFAGPCCGAYFALYGADGVKIEPPEGDWMRILGNGFGDQTPHSIVDRKSTRLNSSH